MDDVAFRGGAEVGVERDDEINFDKQRKKCGEQKGKGDVSVQKAHEANAVFSCVP